MIDICNFIPPKKHPSELEFIHFVYETGIRRLSQPFSHFYHRIFLVFKGSGTFKAEGKEIRLKKGDVFFVEAGTIHAIGKGNVIAEIQQNSDLTYRVFDYNRRQSDGSLRELHVDRALDVVRSFTDAEVEAIRFEARDAQDDEDTLAHCRYFRTRRLVVNGERAETVTPDSFVALLCVEGEGEIFFNGMSYSIKKGEQYFLPAGMGTYLLRGGMMLLSASL